MRGSDSNIIKVAPVRQNNLQAGWLTIWHCTNIGLAAATSDPLSDESLITTMFQSAGSTLLSSSIYASSVSAPGQILMNIQGASRAEFMVAGATAGETVNLQAFGFDEVPMAEVQNVASDAGLASSMGFPKQTNSDGQGTSLAKGIPYALDVAPESLLALLTAAQRDTYAAMTDPYIALVNSANTGYLTRRGPLYRTPMWTKAAVTGHSDLHQVTCTRPVRFDCRGAAMVYCAVSYAGAATNWTLLGRFV